MANADRIVKVGSQGVQFGNCWVSHEKITRCSAEQLNQGKGGIIGQQYMKWLQGVDPEYELKMAALLSKQAKIHLSSGYQFMEHPLATEVQKEIDALKATRDIPG